MRRLPLLFVLFCAIGMALIAFEDGYDGMLTMTGLGLIFSFSVFVLAMIMALTGVLSGVRDILFRLYPLCVVVSLVFIPGAPAFDPFFGAIIFVFLWTAYLFALRASETGKGETLRYFSALIPKDGFDLSRRVAEIALIVVPFLYLSFVSGRIESMIVAVAAYTAWLIPMSYFEIFGPNINRLHYIYKERVRSRRHTSRSFAVPAIMVVVSALWIGFSWD